MTLKSVLIKNYCIRVSTKTENAMDMELNTVDLVPLRLRSTRANSKMDYVMEKELNTMTTKKFTMGYGKPVKK